MNARVLAVALVLAVAPSAQTIYAVTDDGDVVALSSNGTWRAAEEAELAAYYGPSLPAAPLGLGLVYQIDPVLGWGDSTTGDLYDGEAFLQFRHQPVFAVTVYEEAGYPLDFMRDLLLHNAGNAGAEPEILREEVGEVNGVQTLTIEFRSHPEGSLPLRFQITAFMLPEATIQLSTWTFDALFERNRDILDELRSAVRILPVTAAGASKI